MAMQVCIIDVRIITTYTLYISTCDGSIGTLLLTPHGGTVALKLVPGRLLLKFVIICEVLLVLVGTLVKTIP
jgi:hypothetical protein